MKDEELILYKYENDNKKISDKEKLRLTKVFLEFNESFEDLMQRNIIKDAYIWK